MTAVILQARLDSSRLPSKALLPLGGEPMLFRVMEALSTVAADCCVLACPEDAAASFAPLADRCGFKLLTGSKEDVLERYCDAIRRFGPDWVIRATGDNPFVFADAATALAAETDAAGAQYGGYADLPYGAGVEAVAAEALLRAEREAREPAEREHVCPYLYGHPELFSLYRPRAPLRWNRRDLRLTVDTRQDYESALLLHERLDQEESGAPVGRRYQGTTIIAAQDALIRETQR